MRVQRVADEVYARWGNDLNRIMTAEDIRLRFDESWWPELFVADNMRREISLNRYLTYDTKRCLIAHALGHYFLEGGNRLHFVESDPAVLERSEQEAWDFAAFLLLPDAVLSKSNLRSIASIAQAYQVAEDLVRRRLILVVEGGG